MRVAIYNSDTQESKRLKRMIIQGLAKEEIPYDEDQPDLVISIGGDGTLLSAFNHYEDRLDEIRFVGMHTGHLGFYTDWRTFEVFDLIESLKTDSGQSVAYPLLNVEAKFSDGTRQNFVALNESTIRDMVKTMVCDVYINAELFERFRGDGLCISTPTGSTAYNKSVGGAIMDPKIVGFQLGEMASLNNRVFRTLGSPIIFGKDAVLTLRLEDDSTAVLSCDRTQIMLGEVRHLTELTYSVAEQQIRFAKYRHTNFWRRVKASFIGGEA